MKMLCAQDLAIATAMMKDTLNVRWAFSARLTTDYVIIEDERGIICTELSMGDVGARIKRIVGIMA